jgi:RNA polymerase sigma-70 factor (ECF subfamily)
LNQERGGPDSGRLCPEHWVEEHGDYLYCFAMARVHEPESAEDLVQDTLLAGLKAMASFAGRSSERTWLTGILKKKMMDRMRQLHPAVLLGELAQPDAFLEKFYDRSGHWQVGLREWRGDPVRTLERREFWESFERCLAHLPVRLRVVFTSRLLDDVTPAEICQELGISATNLWALVHRARVRLWRCLDRTGFGPSAAGEQR